MPKYHLPSVLLVTTETKRRPISYQYTNQKRAVVTSYIRRSGNRLLCLYYRASLSNFRWYIQHTNPVRICPVRGGDGRVFYYFRMMQSPSFCAKYFLSYDCALTV